MTAPNEKQYLAQLEQALAMTSLSEKERREILLEVENHLGEARASGVRADEVLYRFGPAAELARAYAVELMHVPANAPGARWMSWLFRIAAAIASGIMTALLGAVGVGMITAGVMAVAYGMVGPWLPPAWGDLVLRVGLPQVMFVLVGGLVAIAGVVTVRVLLFNLTILSNAIFKTKEHPS